MALSLASSPAFDVRDRWNTCLVRRALLTGPALYATGGIAISNLADFGWGETHTLQGIITNGTTYYGLYLDYANQKVIVVAFSTGAEVANNTVLSAFSGYIVATGK